MRAQSRGQHARNRRWWTRWWIAALAVVVVGGVAGGVVAVHAHQAHETQVRAARAVAEAQAQAAAAARAKAIAIEHEKSELTTGLTLSPQSGATNVAPNAVVAVTARAGALRSVVVTDATGQTLSGALAAGNKSWKSSSTLQPGSAYRMTAAVATPDGVTVSKTSDFTVLTPTAVVTASVYPTTDMTVGVGQPVVIHFDHSIGTTAAQQAVLSHLTVAESKPVPGGWYWFSPYELHFRPEAYWPAGERISISGDLNGWDAGAGRWGSGLVEDSFSIGDARISYANLQTEHMTVTLNGKVIADYPISGGSTKYPTMDGDHIVLDRSSVVHMVSSTVGIPVNSPDGYDEYVYNDVHISDSGEYVHAAPWSVGDQGVTNVSHGCINLSTANSAAFFGFSRVGDVVEVAGSPRPAVSGDHGVMDWSTPWSQWTPGHVVQLTASSGGATA